jgi:hypothetical protein
VPPRYDASAILIVDSNSNSSNALRQSIATFAKSHRIIILRNAVELFQYLAETSIYPTLIKPYPSLVVVTDEIDTRCNVATIIKEIASTAIHVLVSAEGGNILINATAAENSSHSLANVVHIEQIGVMLPHNLHS